MQQTSTEAVTPEGASPEPNTSGPVNQAAAGSLFDQLERDAIKLDARIDLVRRELLRRGDEGRELATALWSLERRLEPVVHGLRGLAVRAKATLP